MKAALQRVQKAEAASGKSRRARPQRRCLRGVGDRSAGSEGLAGRRQAQQTTRRSRRACFGFCRGGRQGAGSGNAEEYRLQPDVVPQRPAHLSAEHSCQRRHRPAQQGAFVIRSRGPSSAKLKPGTFIVRLRAIFVLCVLHAEVLRAATFSIDNIHVHEQPQAGGDGIMVQDPAHPSNHRAQIYIPQIEVDVRVSEQAQSKNLMAKAYFFRRDREDYRNGEKSQRWRNILSATACEAILIRTRGRRLFLPTQGRNFSFHCR